MSEAKRKSGTLRGGMRRAVVRQLKARKRDAEESGDETAAARAESALKSLERRRCHRTEERFGVPPCPKTFAPPVAGSRTHLYCSEECALLEVAHKEGWAPEETIARMRGRTEEARERLTKVRAERGGRVRLVSPRSPAAPRPQRPTRLQDSPRRAESAPRATSDSRVDQTVDQTKGPWREVAQVLKEEVSRTTAFARMACGHEIAVPQRAKRYRCRKCIGSQLPIVQGVSDGVQSNNRGSR